jgi:hypothetical protein
VPSPEDRVLVGLMLGCYAFLIFVVLMFNKIRKCKKDGDTLDVKENIMK